MQHSNLKTPSEDFHCNLQLGCHSAIRGSAPATEAPRLQAPTFTAQIRQWPHATRGGSAVLQCYRCFMRTLPRPVQPKSRRITAVHCARGAGRGGRGALDRLKQGKRSSRASSRRFSSSGTPYPCCTHTWTGAEQQATNSTAVSTEYAPTPHHPITLLRMGLGQEGSC